MAIASAGIGSNLDVNGIISQLMAVEQRPLLALTKQEASYQSKISALASLKGALSGFQTAVRGLSSASNFQTIKSTVADTSVLTASTVSTAAPGSYAIEVKQLAQAQKLTAAGQANTTDAIGSGTITIDFGTISGGTFDAETGKYTGAGFASNGSGTKTVTIDASNNSLVGIRDAINAANLGVTATIVNDGSTNPYRLVLTSATAGASNSLKVSVAGDAGLQNLLNHNPADNAGQNLSQTVAARSALLKVDGLEVSKNSNTISDMIQGVTLNLLKTNEGNPTTLTVTRDTSGIKTSVENFVKSYNDLHKTLKDLASYDSATQKAGVLLGDGAVMSIQRQLRNAFNMPLAGNVGDYKSLPQIGINFQTDGTLALDASKLQAAINAAPQNVVGLFASAGRPSDSLVSFVSQTSKTQAGTYALNVTQLATQGKVAGGAAVTFPFDVTGGVNDTLNVTVDGIAASLTLTAKTYASATELVAELQSKLNGVTALSSAGVAVTVSESAGMLTLTSNRYGSVSSVSLDGGNALAGLFGTPLTTGALGKDVAGTLGGVQATGSGQFLTGAAGNGAEGLRVQIMGGATGGRGTVDFTRGYAHRLDNLLNDLLSDKGPIANRTDGINRTIKDIEGRRDAISRRLTMVEQRYRTQFTALDTLVGKMLQTSSYLQQQLANLPKIGNGA